MAIASPKVGNPLHAINHIQIIMNTFLKSSFSWHAIVLLCSMVGCNAERVAVGPAPPREQEIMRFRSTDSTKEPTVFGRIRVMDKEAGTYALSSAILSLDKKISYADETGDYRLILEPGMHQFMTGQIGIHQSRLILQVVRGDSVRINFNLRPDLRPLE